MGANDICEHVAKTDQVLTAENAFDYLHARDVYEYGHGGYTGSWAEVPNIVKAPRQPAMLREQARIVAHAALNSDDGPRKWDAGHWIPVVLALPGTERSVEVPLSEAQRVEAGVERWSSGDLDILGRLLGRSDDEQFAALEIGPASVKRKVEVRSVPGKVETRYFVSLGGGRMDLRWEAGFATASQARKALVDALASATGQTEDVAEEVVAMRRRENGDPLIAGTARLTSSATPVKAHFAKPSAEVVGWVLYAIASS